MSKSPGEKEDRKAYMRSKGIQTAAKKLVKEGYYKDIDTNKKEDERLAKQKADRMKIIARAADRVQSGAAAKDAEKQAKADMKQKGAQKGMAPTKKDVEEQIQELRTMIREGNDKIAAYKLLSQILNNKENLGE
jgi:GH25 family lysozyme M1 (1,4-beta-N-acetylmuramidase)